ncbi:helix-turn-helix domain-containing protein [Leptobacterium flavescens]|uniref:Helix-turn-helix domain-containing protein n=1 Tax=Leptobacterium flavescens TaxID=472055 RepID=A0A6P0URJ3_9FLAO|nr:AraC family transcriptional regulator [Leptobacterium flavescens]NER12996.1 helix-turn-helix domain-containing protein [Leptobacterium flavescens]
MRVFTFSFYIFLFISFCTNTDINAQTSFKIPDSLRGKTYEELEKVIVNSGYNFSLSGVHAKSYLQKAKIDRDSAHLATAYRNLAYLLKEDEVRLLYLDSLILITKKRNDSIYTAQGYVFKGGVYYGNQNFKNALDNYLEANSYVGNKNAFLQNQIRFNIGLLKNDLGEYEEALEHFREYFSYALKNEENKFNYYNSLFALSTVFRNLKEVDSAFYYNDIALKKVLPGEKGYWYYQFTFNGAKNEYLKGNYENTIEYLNEVLPFFEKGGDDTELLLLYSYLGKAFYQLKNNEEGIYYLKKAASIFEKNRKIAPEIRDGYEMLINYYKEKNDYQNQLVYIDQLMSFDSILQNNYRYLSKNIITKYDTAKLISEKDDIISTLQSQKRISFIKNNVLSILLFLAILLIIYLYYRRLIYQKRFEKFMREQKNPPKPQKTISRQRIEVPKDIVDDILKGLQMFEDKHAFTDQQITLSKLAKKLNTNTKYLSQVINFSERKSFISYINDLRIAHAISRLQTDRTFKNYTIKSIAHEVGFNHPETFAKAFYKYSGVYPSFFIKQLNKKASSMSKTG